MPPARYSCRHYSAPTNKLMRPNPSSFRFLSPRNCSIVKLSSCFIALFCSLFDVGHLPLAINSQPPSRPPAPTGRHLPAQGIARKIFSIEAPFEVFRDERGERFLASVRPARAVLFRSFRCSRDFTRRQGRPSKLKRRHHSTSAAQTIIRPP